MGEIGPERIVRLLLDNISEEGVSVHQIVCKTGLDHRTVKKYLNMVVEIQATPKISKDLLGIYDFYLIVNSHCTDLPL